MTKKSDVMRYSNDELAAMKARGESRTDWARAAAMTDADLEAGMDIDWARTGIELPEHNTVLRAFIDAQQQRR